MKPVRAFAFPALAELAGAAHNGAAQVDPGAAALSEATARGFAQGLAEGRAKAAEEFEASVTAARQKAQAAGQREGLARLQNVVLTLREAIKQLETERAALAGAAEHLGVDLALAALARLAAVDAVRADFLQRAIANALQALGPQPRVVVVLNPADRALAGGALTQLPMRTDEALPVGTVRVDGGRLVVEAALEDALEQLRASWWTTRDRREHVQQQGEQT